MFTVAPKVFGKQAKKNPRRQECKRGDTDDVDRARSPLEKLHTLVDATPDCPAGKIVMKCSMTNQIPDRASIESAHNAAWRALETAQEARRDARLAIKLGIACIAVLVVLIIAVVR